MPSISDFIRSDKIKLDALFDAGDVTITNSHGLIPPYSTGSKIFDDDDVGASPDFSFIALNANSADSFTNISINNGKAPTANYLRLVVSIALAGNIVINEGDPDELTIEWDTKRTTRSNSPKVIELNLGKKVLVKKVKINYTSFEADPGTNSLDDPRLYGLHLYNVIRPSDEFEFNDSVLTTKAWNSSRYSGKQLSAAKINRFTPGDSTYGKTSVIQNYSRNIYIGNDIVGMNSTADSNEDSSLLQFDNFSYLQTNTYITVNEDDSITLNNLGEIVEDDYREIIGFYQAFFDDFKEGTNCRVVLTDPVQKSKLDPSYTIYFNGGQLQQILQLTPGGDNESDAHLKYLSSTNNFVYNNAGGTLGFTATIFNENILSEFFTGSLSSEASLQPIPAVPGVPGSDIGGGGGLILVPGEDVTEAKLENLFEAAEKYKNNSTYKGDKRFFTTFTISGSSSPIRTITSGSIPTINRSTNLAELSTAEIQSHNSSTNIISFTNKTRLNQDYIAYHASDAPTPQQHVSGSIILSKVNDSTPSLLVPLNKPLQLPDVDFTKPYVILPHNLHPYIKDNLSYFLTQAGINVGGDTSTLIKINPSNRLLK